MESLVLGIDILALSEECEHSLPIKCDIKLSYTDESTEWYQFETSPNLRHPVEVVVIEFPGSSKTMNTIEIPECRSVAANTPLPIGGKPISFSSNNLHIISLEEDNNYANNRVPPNMSQQSYSWIIIVIILPIIKSLMWKFYTHSFPKLSKTTVQTAIPLHSSNTPQIAKSAHYFVGESDEPDEPVPTATTPVNQTESPPRVPSPDNISAESCSALYIYQCSKHFQEGVISPSISVGDSNCEGDMGIQEPRIEHTTESWDSLLHISEMSIVDTNNYCSESETSEFNDNISTSSSELGLVECVATISEQWHDGDESCAQSAGVSLDELSSQDTPNISTESTRMERAMCTIAGHITDNVETTEPPTVTPVDDEADYLVRRMDDIPSTNTSFGSNQGPYDECSFRLVTEPDSADVADIPDDDEQWQSLFDKVFEEH